MNPTALGRLSGRAWRWLVICAAVAVTLTAIIRFGSLLAAQNQTLFSFGVFTAVGEVATVATATLTFPAWLAFRERFSKKAEVVCPSD